MGGQMSAVETEREAERGRDGSTQHLFCCQTEEKGRHPARCSNTSAYSSALSDALFLFFFLSHSEQRAIRTDIPASVAFEAAGSRRSTHAQSEGNTDAL